MRLPPDWCATYIILLDSCYTRSERRGASPYTIRRHLLHMDHPLDLQCHLLQFTCSPFEVEGEGELIGEVVVEMVREVIVHLSQHCLLPYPPPPPPILTHHPILPYFPKLTHHPILLYPHQLTHHLPYPHTLTHLVKSLPMIVNWVSHSASLGRMYHLEDQIVQLYPWLHSTFKDLSNNTSHAQI